jgi:hypothetical protein
MVFNNFLFYASSVHFFGVWDYSKVIVKESFGALKKVIYLLMGHIRHWSRKTTCNCDNWNYNVSRRSIQACFVEWRIVRLRLPREIHIIASISCGSYKRKKENDFLSKQVIDNGRKGKDCQWIRKRL